MEKEQARKIFNHFYEMDNLTEDDEFIFIEACNYLIDTENDAEVMSCLGGYYYGKQKYNLAEKYYLMAHENGDEYAPNGLGFIYYYGRNGERDYKKAFYYFNIAKDKGNLEAAMKIADMCHNGYGTEKNDDKYKKILLQIFEEIKDTDKLFDPYPEVAHRLAEIYIREGHGNDAIEMLLKGKSFIEQRIRYNPFWGNFIVCRRLLIIFYQLVEFNFLDMNFFDLFYLFREPHTVKLTFEGKTFLIESLFDEGEMRVKCENKYYKSTEDFLINALFNEQHTYVIEYSKYYKLTLVK